MFASRELGELLAEMDAARRRPRRADDEHEQALEARAVVRRRAPGALQHRPRWARPPEADAEPAQPRELRARLPGRVHRGRARVLGRRDVPADRRRSTSRSTRSAASSSSRWCMNAGLPGPADPGRRAEPGHLDRVCVPVPRAEARHDARRRPLVGHGDPPDDQVREPAADDLGVGAAAPARVAAALHADRAARTGSCSPPTRRCCRSPAASRRPSELDLAPEVLDNYLYGNAQAFFFGGGAESS